MPPPTERAQTEQWAQATPPHSTARPMPSGTAPPAVARGSLLILRQFDVADEIDLAKAANLQFGERITLTRPRATALLLSNPPLSIGLGRRTLDLSGRRVEVDVFGRVFDFGAISIRLRIALPEGMSWEELSSLTRLVAQDDAPTRLAREVATELVPRLRPAITGAHQSDLFEDYAIVYVEQFAGNASTQSLPADAIARLLLGEPENVNLSEAEVEETVRRRSSYLGEDLCVMGWNVALVVEPAGDRDPIDVLELANAQLLELRYYDNLLDRELSRLYDEVALQRGQSRRLLRNYGPVLRRAMALMMEIAEFVERAENALKIIGDVYLARLYSSAVESLRIPSWERAVTRKQALVQQVYDVLKSEVDVRRAQVLEIIVILLILGELLQAVKFG